MMETREELGLVHRKKLRLGQKMIVTKGIHPKDDALWLDGGDIVKVIGIYPHVVLVEKLESRTKGYRLRECFPRESWELNLRIIA